MSIKIDITNMDGDTLRNLLAKFPDGRVIVDESKAFWKAESRTSNTVERRLGGGIHKEMADVANHNPIGKMRDSLFEAFS
jgi:hypothetical protein